VTVFRFVHPWKVLFRIPQSHIFLPYVASPTILCCPKRSGKEISSKELQPANVIYEYNLFSVLGITMVFRPLQPLKASIPIELTPSGITIFSMLLQSLKALAETLLKEYVLPS
jgi:hypothetical protein